MDDTAFVITIFSAKLGAKPVHQVAEILRNIADECDETGRLPVRIIQDETGIALGFIENPNLL